MKKQHRSRRPVRLLDRSLLEGVTGGQSGSAPLASTSPDVRQLLIGDSCCAHGSPPIVEPAPPAPQDNAAACDHRPDAEVGAEPQDVATPDPAEVGGDPGDMPLVDATDLDDS